MKKYTIRTFCITCAAQATAEVAPDYEYRTAAQWTHSGVCARCGKEKPVMSYALRRAGDSDHGKDEEA